MEGTAQERRGSLRVVPAAQSQKGFPGIAQPYGAFLSGLLVLHSMSHTLYHSVSVRLSGMLELPCLWARLVHGGDPVATLDIRRAHLAVGVDVPSTALRLQASAPLLPSLYPIGGIPSLRALLRLAPASPQFTQHLT